MRKGEMICMTCGIYLITNERTGDTYVGCSIDIERRYKDHLIRLKNKTHTLKWLNNFTGCEDYKLHILEETENLVDREKFYINKLKPTLNDCVKRYTTYPDELKLEIYSIFIETPDISTSEISRTYNIPTQTIDGWRWGKVGLNFFEKHFGRKIVEQVSAKKLDISITIFKDIIEHPDMSTNYFASKYNKNAGTLGDWRLGRYKKNFFKKHFDPKLVEDTIQAYKTRKTRKLK